MRHPFNEPFKIDQEFGVKTDYGYHCGEDWNGIHGGNTDLGYKLYPITRGVIHHVSNSSTGFGPIVVYRIDGPWGTRWIRYAHCKSILQTEGECFPDKPIAELGNEGNSTAAHLHWSVIKKPLNNWRMVARDKATLDEYFEDPSEFLSNWWHSDKVGENSGDVRIKILNNYRSDKFSKGIITEGDIREVIGGFERSITLQKDLDNEREEIKLLRKVIDEKVSLIETLEQEYGSNISKLEGQIEALEKAVGTQNNQELPIIKPKMSKIQGFWDKLPKEAKVSVYVVVSAVIAEAIRLLGMVQVESVIVMALVNIVIVSLVEFKKRLTK